MQRRILGRSPRVMYLSTMSRHAVRSLSDYLHRVSGDAAPGPDADLLRQFVEADDHRAFAALLGRYGPMVLGTARRLVHDAAEAEDVFQAAFLSLARLAGTIRRGQTVSHWLYAATCRIAARVRRRRAVSIDLMPEPGVANTAETDLAWREVRTALDEELARLPDRLRSPLLLCYLAGLSRDEAAEHLGWSLGTLKRRLAAGRAALRQRLERRGIPAVGLALAALCPSALDAAVRPGLARACLGAVCGNETAVRVSALLLTTSTTFKSLAMKAVMVSLALVALGIGIYSGVGRADQPGPAGVKKMTELPAAAKRVDALGDPLPDGALMRLGTHRFRAHLDHPARPFQWLYRPDGKSYLVRHSNVTAAEIRRIDAKTGAVVEAWPIPKSRGALAWANRDDDVVGFSPDGRYAVWTNEYIHHGVVEAPQEWHLTCYDLTGRKPLWSVSKKRESKDWPATAQCVFSTNGKWFVTGGPNGKDVRLWDARTGEQLWEHRHEGQSLSPVGFAGDGDTVVLRGENDGTIYLFDRAKGTERKSFPTTGRMSWGQNLLSPDGKHLVLCTLQPPSIWDLEGKRVAVLEGHTKWANAAAFSPDGKKLGAGLGDFLS